MMNDLQGTIAGAIPPPPNWQEVANTFLDTISPDFWNMMASYQSWYDNWFQTKAVPEIERIVNEHEQWTENYLGEPTAAPTKQEIDSKLPSPPGYLDTSTGVENLKPESPIQEKMNFDISTGTPIEIVDESKPFTISDPLQNLAEDEPGVMVFPGDIRNSSNGIKAPDTIESPDPIPQHKPEGIPDIPDNPTPTPEQQIEQPPIPSQTVDPPPVPSGGITLPIDYVPGRG